MDGHRLIALLVCQVRERTCALPVERVHETLRPPPLTRLPAAPTFVRGVALIRGQSTPVLDVGELLGLGPTSAKRLVTLRGSETVPSTPCALAVDSVEGIRHLPESTIQHMPAWIQGDVGSPVFGTSPQAGELMIVLDSLKMLSHADEVLTQEEAGHDTPREGADS